jgi:hypothetical protein
MYFNVSAGMTGLEGTLAHLWLVTLHLFEDEAVTLGTVSPASL